MLNTRKALFRDAILFVGFFVAMTLMLLFLGGFSSKEGVFTFERFKFLSNFLANPVLLVLYVSGAILVLYALFSTLFQKSTRGIWFSGVGTILVVLSLLCLLGYNDTPIYPSIAYPQSSLTIQNASGSHYTLSAMSYVSLMVPFVLGYIYLAWRSMNKTQLTSEEIASDEHHY